jgi:hypothetical protein
MWRSGHHIPWHQHCRVSFSILRWEKDNFRKSLSDFGLEGVMQSKQWTFLEQFEQ